MKNLLTIKKFVQTVLGCTCPDEVFEQIDDRHVLLPQSPHTRSITIGERLLIYVWETDGQKDLQEGLQAMLETGKKERDDRGLNRFRAVLGVENPEIEKPRAELSFSHFVDRDDRMHIHVVSLNALQKF